MILATVLLVLLFIIGVPVALTMGIAPIVGLLEKRLPLVGIPESLFEMLDSFALLAVIFFVLAGRLMQNAGVARRLVDLAVALTGWMRGGLGSAAVLTTMMFSTMSGSSSATTAAIGGVLTPEMERSRYPRPFIAALLATSGELGVIIPPTVTMILYSVVTGVSVTQLFTAGILPGLLIGLSLIVTVMVVSAIKGYGELKRVPLAAWLAELWLAFRRAFLSLLTPVIILGGIYSGFFTPTEAGVVAVAYTLFLGMVVYRQIHLRDLPKIFAEAAVTTAAVMLIAAFAAVMAYVLAIYQVPQHISRGIISISDSPIVFLLLVNVILLIAGTFLESFAAIIILAPVLAPVAATLGIHPVHFAVIMNINLAIGMITPPTAVNLFIMCSIARVTMEQMTKPLLVFLGVMLINLVLITYVPWFSLALLG